MLPAAFVNYIVAAILGGLGLLLFHAPMPHALSVRLGLATGLTYALSLLCLEIAMRTSGVSIAVAALQLSVLVPTVLSMLVFRERPGPVQCVGIAVAIPALWLLSGSRAVSAGARISLRRAAVNLLLLFLVTGCSGVFMKAFEVYCPQQDRLAYTAVLFTVSTLVIGLVLIRRKIPWGPLAWPVGSLIGLSNLFQLQAVLKALSVLPAIVVFPVTSALTVSLNAVLAVRFWQERLNTRALVGIALAILSAILLNGHG